MTSKKIIMGVLITLMMLQLFSSFSEFERNRLKERTIDGLNRAKANGKVLGRPRALKTTALVQTCQSRGLSQSRVAKELSMSLSTIKRHWLSTPVE
jgi:DNA invertase Pin-like site-specific DNA recombinase